MKAFHPSKRPRGLLKPLNSSVFLTPVVSSNRAKAADLNGEKENPKVSATEDELEKVAGPTRHSVGALDSDLKREGQFPSFDEEEGLSPFPDFIEYREEKYDLTDLHCTIHCNHIICKSIEWTQEQAQPQCECSLGERNLTIKADLTQADIRGMEALSEDTPISIFRSDVGNFIRDVGNNSNYINVCALHSCEAFRAAAKGKRYTYLMDAASAAREALITTMMHYFTRIFSSPLEQITGTTTISRKQLKLDITAVLGLTLWEFISEYFNESCFSNGQSGYSPRKIVQLLEYCDVADAVWTAWDNTIDDLIMLCTVRHVRYVALLSGWTNEILG
ncbi:hypothetical protein K505DRAFT_359922 [Melanomma pulvis-pyrius CBS 109.77]|uniref:Uncharacterized protein n=1 Tax=Melanomma pulvis-pyrius CBS 109.77 TaxID=1314802 RepID=A0A6A6XJE5_9PLEO|nr:hypothetical protein K505DRAFT_359922 [Melanomma pulvis-pyrius CBS 109.77]